MDIRTPLILVFITLNMLVLAEVYLELNEVRSYMNEKTLILNKEYSKITHMQTLSDFYNEAMSRE